MVDKPQNYLAQQCANFIYEITKIKQNKFNLFLFHMKKLIIIHIEIKMYNISINLLIAHSKESAGKYISVVEYCSDKAKVVGSIPTISIGC